MYLIQTKTEYLLIDVMRYYATLTLYIGLLIVLFFATFLSMRNINTTTSFSGLNLERWSRGIRIEFYSLKSSLLVDIQYSR